MRPKSVNQWVGEVEAAQSVGYAVAVNGVGYEDGVTLHILACIAHGHSYGGVSQHGNVVAACSIDLKSVSAMGSSPKYS